MALTKDHYTIGWVAALEVELAAAMAMLDKRHPKLSKDVADTNSYTLGSIGGHNIVVAGLPSGSVGNNPAVHAATNMLRSFPKIKFILMVGVGGGVSDASVAPLKDVRLGDIVVSNPEGSHGGVIQYDFGTGSQASGFVRKGALNKPPIAIRTSLTEFRAHARLNRYSFMKHYEDVFERNPGMEREEYEPPEYDRLYKADYIHVGEGDCSNCSDSGLVIRRDRTKKGPIVHFGTIGSANMVLRDALLREELYKDGMICFEMEAAGLMDLGCLVIRGICGKDWQPYASMVAAAFTKDFLLTIDAQVINAIPEATLELIRDDIHEVKLGTEQLLNAQQSSYMLEAIRWLDAPNAELDHHKALESRELGTSSWILDSTTYTDWKQDNVRHLWLHGKAGSGKTIISATVAEDIRAHCKTHSDLQCAVFYFTFSDTRKQSYTDCIRSILCQMVKAMPISRLLIESYHASQGIPPSRQSLEKIFLCIVDSTQGMYLILDALDESPEIYNGNQSIRQELLQRLAILAATTEKLKIFATSRELSDIQMHMKVLGAHSVAMASESINIDIAKYIRSQLTQDSKLRSLCSGLKNKIQKVLVDSADGMFRWAYCQLREITELQSLKESNIEAILKMLPKSLDETYDRIIKRIHSQSKKEALIMLRWLAYSQRPLTLQELAETTAIDPYYGQDGLVSLANREEFEAILDILSGLVTISEYSDNQKGSESWFPTHAERSVELVVEDYDDLDMDIDMDTLEAAFKNHITDEMQIVESSKVQKAIVTGSHSLHPHNLVKLAHFSVKEYLESARISEGPARFFHLDETQGQSFLSHSSIAYLIHYASHRRRSGKRDDLIRFPLLQYAARFWFVHHQEVEEVFLTTALLSSQTALECWLQIYDPDRPDQQPFKISNPSNIRMVASGVYYATMLNLPSILRELFRSGANVNSQGGWYGTPLYAAVRLEYQQIVELLLDNGADVNAQIERFHGSVLVAACAAGQERLVRLLIEHQADVNIRTKTHMRSPLFAALAGDHGDIIRILLESGANMDEVTPSAKLLKFTIRNGDERLAQTLIQRGIDINGEPTAQIDALKQSQRQLSTIEFLVQNGWKNINSVDSDGWTLLHHLMDCKMYNTATLHFLVSSGADINLVSGNSETPLMIAARVNNVQAVDDIIAANGCINGLNFDGHSALQIAIMNRRPEIVTRLLVAGADTENVDIHGQTALHLAMNEYDPETIYLLLNAGADVNRYRPDGYTHLMDAIFSDSCDIVRILLNAKADIKSRSPFGRTALDLAIFLDNASVVSLLVDAGALVSYKRLKRAIFNNQTAELDVLLAAGTDPNMLDGNGPLLLDAIESGHIDIARTLLEAGAYPNQMNALCYAACVGDVDMTNLLIKAGAIIDSQDHFCRTAFWYATKHGHWQVMYCLAQARIQAGVSTRTLMARDIFGISPLHLAAWNGISSDVEWLVNWLVRSETKRLGLSRARLIAVDRFSGDVNGRSVFHYAAISGSVETLNILIHYLTSWNILLASKWVDYTDQTSKTILDYACLSGSPEMVRRALELVPIESQIVGRWSSMHWACRAASFEVLEILAAARRTASAVETIQTGLAWTPLDIAVHFSNTNLVTKDDLALQRHNWATLVTSGIVFYNNGDEQITPYRENKLWGIELPGADCDGCLQDVGPLYNKCLTCEGIKHCLMCSHASESFHVNHEWIFVNARESIDEVDSSLDSDSNSSDDEVNSSLNSNPSQDEDMISI